MTDPDDTLPDDQQEDAKDLNLVSEWFSGPTLWSTDWTTETIVGQLKRGNINLNPRYQRRNAWASSRKSLFIESLILGLPIPEIILAEEKGKKGSFIVIDGKQRLLAIRQFASEKDDKKFPQLKLTGLEDREDLNGLSYDKLKSSDILQDDLNTFDNQTIRTVVIRGWKDEKYLYSVFLRINTGRVQLSPQELRQALHPGNFSDFIDDFSTESKSMTSALKLKQPDFRMRDVELVLRYFAYKNNLSNYKGDLKAFLDNTTKDFNKRWDSVEELVRRQGSELDNALDATRQIFGDRDELRKWNGENYEKRINRAVFYIMIYYFYFYVIIIKALKHSEEIKKRFEELCNINSEFVSSLESTTKSIDSNKKRFQVWAHTLSEILSTNVTSPL